MRALDVNNTANSQIASSRNRELGSGSNLLGQLESRVNDALRNGASDRLNGNDTAVGMTDKLSQQQIMEYLGVMAVNAGQPQPAGTLIPNTVI